MRILLFHFSTLGGLGGVEVAVHCLAEEFTKAGCPSGILELGLAWKSKRFIDGNIPVWTVTASSYPTLKRPRSWASLARVTQQFMHVVREFEPDVVQVHFPLGQSMPVVAAHALPHRWRLVATVHNSDIRVAPFQEPRIRPWQTRLLQRADAVTAVSESMMQDTLQLYPAISGKVSVISNGVDSTWFQARALSGNGDKQKYVLFVGRFHPAKGVDLLLRAWQHVGPRFAGVKLWLVGDGPELENLQVLARDLGITSIVSFLGSRPQEELPPLYRNAEAVVLPSRREGMPFTLLEAGACGAICIATRIPGMSEVIEDGQTGFIIDPESQDDLAAAIKKVLELDSEQRCQIGKAAQVAIRKGFSTERMVSNYLELFQRLIGNTTRMAQRSEMAPAS